MEAKPRVEVDDFLVFSTALIALLSSGFSELHI